MARFDGNLKAVGEAKLDVDELLSALSGSSGTGRKERQEAIACFLSASEGWMDAKSRLKGTFASAVKPSWLTSDKD
ncbi:hypothetical protein LZ496_06440 [Sphingomonas sp. NSE70-1]|uniref:Uncharacterized protein n=1 Tax=Sphingomonas caseinilyticus TaxID=2908205 RepID=A0ABT0RTT1_9SPHN|nr:hypothetical protein [Sphingomonas caseinilyticus]MCL6698420.1 hypothetical protein [Sphingomonas caseinilyticus]